MDTSVLVKQRNKLIGIGIFLVLIVFAIGGEDSPGVIPSLANKSAAEPQRDVEVVPRRIAEQEHADAPTELDSWYSESGAADEPMVAAPDVDASPTTTFDSSPKPAPAARPAPSEPAGSGPPPGYRELQ